MNTRTTPWIALALFALAAMVIWITAKMARTDLGDYRLAVIGGVMLVGVAVLVGALRLRRR